MTEKELVVELGLTLRRIDELYVEKKRLEQEIKKYADEIVSICRSTGKTIDELER